MRLFFILLLLTATGAVGQENRLVLDASTSLYSQYMYRGVKLYEGLSIQPALTASYLTEQSGNFTASLWSHFPLEGDRTRQGNFQEVDGTLTYDYSVGPIILSTGMTFYTYPTTPDTLESTAEIFAMANFDTVMQPTISVFQDCDQYHDQYYELTLRQPVEPRLLGYRIPFTPFAAIGWGTNVERLYSRNGLAHTTFGALAEIEVIRGLVFTPSIALTQRSDSNTSNQLWGGFTLSYTK